MKSASKDWRAADWISIILLIPFAIVPLVADDFFVFSLANQILIGVTAAFSVYIMLRMDLLSFAVPAFMAIGGYAAAIALKAGITDISLLILLSFFSGALVALPLGVLVLRLRGVYFVLVTFIFTEILQLLIFETPRLTGGSNGISGLPAASFFGISLGSNHMVVLVSVAVAILAAIATLSVTHRFNEEFASIEENETLAQSLGLVIWQYRTIGFVVAGGVASMAGFSLVNMLLTAHPTSFSSFSSIHYIAYVLIGGRRSMLGAVIGACLLVWATNTFSASGEYSAALFGLLLIVVVTVAPSGIVGLLTRLAGTRFARPKFVAIRR